MQIAPKIEFAEGAANQHSAVVFDLSFPSHTFAVLCTLALWLSHGSAPANLLIHHIQLTIGLNPLVRSVLKLDDFEKRWNKIVCKTIVNELQTMSEK